MRKLQQEGGKQNERGRIVNSVDLITAGFPCQPFSHAGKRKGKEDDRYLWPELLTVIQHFQPTWCLLENVRGILTINGGMVFKQVCIDLEESGYEVQPFIIPAVAVNAPHRRDRVWIVACNTNGIRLPRKKEVYTAEAGEQTFNNIKGRHSHAPDTNSWKSRNPSKQKRRKNFSRRNIQDAPDTGCQRPQEQEQQATGRKQFDTDDRYAKCVNVEGERKQQDSKEQDRLCDRERQGWQQNWVEVAAELCGMDDGLPAELDGFKLSKSKHRGERLRALGNAIVPQVAVEIMKAMNKWEVENGRKTN